jgi:hypothetical protein
MDGFKNSTKTQYMKGGSVGERKIGRVMEEFTKGKLHSGSKEGPKVKSTKQAVAIALNEARAAGAKIPRVKKFDGGGVYNERGKRATWDEVAAEGRRMEGRKPPVEGISTRPTDSSGRRMTDKELGMTPGGVAPKKKAMPKGMGAMSDLDMQRAKEAMKKPSTAAAGAAAGAGVMAAARAAARAAATRFGGQVTEGERRMLEAATKKGVPAHSDKPMIRRNMGGLTTMPKGKC